MTSRSIQCIDVTKTRSHMPTPGIFVPTKLRALVAGLVLLACCLATIERAAADPLARANAAYARGDYVLVVNLLTPLAFRGNAQAQAMLGFMF